MIIPLFKIVGIYTNTWDGEKYVLEMSFKFPSYIKLSSEKTQLVMLGHERFINCHCNAWGLGRPLPGPGSGTEGKLETPRANNLAVFLGAPSHIS